MGRPSSEAADGIPGVTLVGEDQVDDPELLEVVESEVDWCEILNDHKFPGDDNPILSGSALLALEALVENPNFARTAPVLGSMLWCRLVTFREHAEAQHLRHLCSACDGSRVMEGQT